MQNNFVKKYEFFAFSSENRAFAMNTSEILTTILSNEDLSVQEFAARIGYPATKLYDIKQGRTKNFNDELIESITAAYPKYSREFLLTGIADYGELSKNTENLASTIHGIHMIVTEMSAQRIMYDKHMTEAFESIKRFQQQTERLITIMEKKL